MDTTTSENLKRTFQAITSLIGSYDEFSMDDFLLSDGFVIYKTKSQTLSFPFFEFDNFWEFINTYGKPEKMMKIAGADSDLGNIILKWMSEETKLDIVWIRYILNHKRELLHNVKVQSPIELSREIKNNFLISLDRTGSLQPIFSNLEFLTRDDLRAIMRNIIDHNLFDVRIGDFKIALGRPFFDHIVILREMKKSNPNPETFINIFRTSLDLLMEP